jgi:protein CpxP
MKRNAWIAAIAAGLLSAAALAQGGPGMGGYGRGMGPGFGGGGYGACDMAGSLDALGLTIEQRSRVAAIMDESATQRLALMDAMHDLRSQGVRGGNPDYAAMAALREQVFTLRSEQRSRIDAVLTPEQRERLASGWGPGRGFGPRR